MFTQFFVKHGMGRSGSNEKHHTLLRLVHPRCGPSEWISLSIQFLVRELRPDRVGVWLEDSATERNPDGVPIFLGEVWDVEPGTSPPEWNRLSASAPLPVEMLRDGLSCSIQTML